MISSCWHCSRPGATAQAVLHSHSQRHAAIAVCATGVGCRDGRVYHGPQGPAPHLPHESCGYCDTRRPPTVDDLTVTERRILAEIRAAGCRVYNGQHYRQLQRLSRSKLVDARFERTRVRGVKSWLITATVPAD